jgi:hypothetical protein
MGGLMPAPDTVRWYVSDFVRRHYAGEVPVLEIGARHEPRQWWRDLRGQLGVDPGAWVGLDMEPGHGVDWVQDITIDTPAPEEFEVVLCSEVLEHVTNPTAALRFCYGALVPGGKVIITVPFAFPVHNYPADYWRFTPDGLRLLLERAGFTDIQTEEMNHFEIVLRDHDEREAKRRPPLHVGAVARKPE